MLTDLQRKAQKLLVSGHWPKVYYSLFSKSGFTPDLQAVARAQGVQLVHAAELVR